MLNTNGIPSSRIVKTVDPEIHKTQEAQKLKESCQQFESILWSKLWKDMRKSAMSISGNDKGRPYQQMEELTLEMASEDLVVSSGGAGLWKMLYDSLSWVSICSATSDEIVRSKCCSGILSLRPDCERSCRVKHSAGMRSNSVFTQEPSTPRIISTPESRQAMRFSGSIAQKKIPLPFTDKGIISYP